jgi:uncharacterized membrane protein YcaP (DUF421 family)
VQLKQQIQMKKEEIHLEDIGRILFGQAPPIFLLEVFVRTLFIYVLLLLIVRWLGKRMSGQLTIMELAVTLTLGAIVSVPMQMPDRGLLQGVLLLLCAVGFQRGISWLGVKSGKFEDLSHGKTSMLIKDGMLQLEQMEKDSISRQQVFSELRQEKIFNLGTVDRLYLEASGLFSVYKAKQPRPGLSIYPPDDRDIFENTDKVGTSVPNQVMLACNSCGYIKNSAEEGNCPVCGNKNWINAVG